MVSHNEAQKLNPQSKTQSVGVLGGWWRSTQNLKTCLNSKIWKLLYMPFMVSFAAKVCTRFENKSLLCWMLVTKKFNCRNQTFLFLDPTDTHLQSNVQVSLSQMQVSVACQRRKFPFTKHKRKFCGRFVIRPEHNDLVLSHGNDSLAHRTLRFQHEAGYVSIVPNRV